MIKPFKYRWPQEIVTHYVLDTGHDGGGGAAVERSDDGHKIDEIIRGLETVSQQLNDLTTPSK